MFQSGILKTSVTTSDGRILDDWARTRTKEGLLYYLNHKHAISQWDHPEYIRIMNELLPINTVQYAAYRTACKLRHLQIRAKFHEVSLQCITSAFDSAGLHAAENCDTVPVREIERVVMYIYRTAFKNKALDSSFCTDLMMNLIQNTFDEKRTSYLQVLKCKILLTVLGGGRLQEKYRYFFSQISDHNNCCTRRMLARFLQSLANITELLSEHLSFGSALVPAAVESCFKEVESDIGITEDSFLAWLMQEPQTLVWWTTLYRVSSAELVCHDIKCGVCKQRPVIGLRYQCLKCLGYNLCQDCFLHGKKSRGHKLIHPIQEYCQESSVKEWRQSLLKIIRHRLRKSNELKPRYLTISQESRQTLRSLLQETDTETSTNLLPTQSNQGLYEEDDQSTEEELTSRTICHSVNDLDKLGVNIIDFSDSSSVSGSSTRLSSEPVIVSSPGQQILSVIKHLEEGQRHLNNRLDDQVSRIPSELVEEHTVELQTQINKLKYILQSYSKQSNFLKVKQENEKGLPRMESTPIVGDRALHLSLSPIGVLNNPNDTAVLDNKENHYTETKNNKEFSSTPQSNYNIDPPRERISLSSISMNKQNSVRKKETYPVYKNCRLPSFTELNWSERTSEYLDPSYNNTSSCSDDYKKVEAVNERVEASDNKADDRSTTANRNKVEKNSHSNLEDFDREIDEVKIELEKILIHLEEIYPEIAIENEKSLYPSGAITAINEIWDGVENYVHCIVTDK